MPETVPGNMRCECVPFALRFRRTIVTGAGAWEVRKGAWLRLVSEDGFVGLGEVAPVEPMATAEDFAAAMERPGYRAAAMDNARLDIEGQRAGRPIASLLAADPRPRIPVNALLFATQVEATLSEALGACAQGYRSLKLKVGVVSPQVDIERIRQVRAAVGPDVDLRIDANGAWDEATALHVLHAVATCRIEYVEDPVSGDTATVRSRCGVPVATDVRSLAWGWDAIRARDTDFLVMKPMLLGGLRPSSDLARAAIENGIGVVISSAFETAVGIAGAVHLAASLPGPERAHGLATLALLEDAPIMGLDEPSGGSLSVPSVPGLGVTLRAQPQ